MFLQILIAKYVWMLPYAIPVHIQIVSVLNVTVTSARIDITEFLLLQLLPRSVIRRVQE